MLGFFYFLLVKNYYFNMWGNECKIEYRKSFRDCNLFYEKLYYKGFNYIYVCFILDFMWFRMYEIGVKYVYN